MKTRILWSGITGRVGRIAKRNSDTNEYATVVAGICRNDEAYYNYDQLDNIKEDFDVIVDFSHKDSFDKVLEFALKVKKPLIIGTGKLTDEQMKAMEDASYIIPIFKGGNFLFKVEEFMKDVVDYAKESNGEIVLIETHYKSKNIPSDTAKVVAKRVLDECGKIVRIESHLEYDEIISDYRVGELHCRVCGFEQLTKDVLKISSMMINKKVDGVYNLNRLVKELDV